MMSNTISNTNACDHRTTEFVQHWANAVEEVCLDCGTRLVRCRECRSVGEFPHTGCSCHDSAPAE